MRSAPTGAWLAVLCHNKVLLIDLQTKQITGSGPLAGNFAGIVFSRDGKKLYASSIKGTIENYAVNEAGKLEALPALALPDVSGGKAVSPVPAGLVLDPQKERLWAVLNMRNSVAEIDLADGRVLREIAVGNAPYDVVCAKGKIYVSNWAGRRPAAGDVAGPSGSAPPVRVDPRTNIAVEGSISVVDPAQDRAVKEIVVGPHTSGLAVSPDGRYVCAANANADTVSVVDTSRDAVIGDHLHAADRRLAVRQRAQRFGLRRRRKNALRFQRHEQRRGRGRAGSAEKPPLGLPAGGLVSGGPGG